MAWCGEWQEMQLTSFLRMHGIDGIHVLRAAGMAGQAAVIDFLGGMVLEDENLGDVAAARDVGRSGAMAAFASLVGRAAFRVQGRLPVRGLLPAVVDVLVAGLARLRPDVVGGIRGRRGSCLAGRCLGAAARDKCAFDACVSACGQARGPDLVTEHSRIAHENMPRSAKDAFSNISYASPSFTFNRNLPFHHEYSAII